MLQDATFWVLVAFVIFVGLAYKKISALVTNALDQRGERIRQELEQAQRLREDAQAVLAECQKRQQEAEQAAEAIIAHAREEADRIRAKAEEDVQLAVKRRELQAIDRIAQAESQALAEVRNFAVDLAITGSRRLFEARVEAGEPDPLVDSSLSNLRSLLN
jgi:F-type H+-transporting ATPase subunit b